MLYFNMDYYQSLENYHSQHASEWTLPITLKEPSFLLSLEALVSYAALSTNELPAWWHTQIAQYDLTTAQLNPRKIIRHNATSGPLKTFMISQKVAAYFNQSPLTTRAVAGLWLDRYDKNGAVLDGETLAYHTAWMLMCTRLDSRAHNQYDESDTAMMLLDLLGALMDKDAQTDALAVGAYIEKRYEQLSEIERTMNNIEYWHIHTGEAWKSEKTPHVPMGVLWDALLGCEQKPQYTEMELNF